MNGEGSINIYSLLCVKWIVAEKLLYNTGNPVFTCDDLDGWDEGGVGRRVEREGIDT